MRDQKINLISLYFLIIAVGLINMLIYFAVCFVLVYQYKADNIANSSILYCLFIVVHLLLNIFVIAKPQKFSMIPRITSSACILLAYIVIAIAFR